MKELKDGEDGKEQGRGFPVGIGSSTRRDRGSGIDNHPGQALASHELRQRHDGKVRRGVLARIGDVAGTVRQRIRRHVHSREV